MVETKTFQGGQVIFREGDQANEAYKVMSGKVAIAMAGAAKPIILAQLGAGDIFGEMGLVDERPRSASAIAIEATTVEVVTLDGLNHMIMNDPVRFLPYLSLFFERLRTTNDRLRMELKLRNAAPARAAAAPTAAELTSAGPQKKAELAAITPIAKQAVVKELVLIAKFPFRIGRADAPGAGAFAVNDMTILDNEPFQVSRSHCSIEREGDRYFIHDRGSRGGTIVNDVAIGPAYQSLTADLNPGGKNVIVLGDDRSPYRFELTFS